MVFEVVQWKWSFTCYEPLGPFTYVLDFINGQVLQRLREQLKVPGSSWNEVNFWLVISRLNETSGGLGKIGAVSGSDCKSLNLLEILDWVHEMKREVLIK